MKSSKIIAITLLISSVLALASEQQQPEDRQFQREQESKNRSALANATADQDRKVTQADLERLQLAKEQETKELQEKCNAPKVQFQNRIIRDGLKELLKGAKIKDEDFNEDLVDRLPSDVQKSIAAMAYSRSFKDGYKLFPALFPIFDSKEMFTPYAKHKIRFSVKLDRLTPTNEYSQTFAEEVQFVCQRSGEVMSFAHNQIAYGFNFDESYQGHISGIIINYRLYLDPCLAKDELCDLDEQAIEYIAWLFNQTFITTPFGLTDANKTIRISSEQAKIHYSLPVTMRRNLERNYDIRIPICHDCVIL